MIHSGAQVAASRERRFSRWLHNQAIVPSEWYLPVVQATLADFPPDERQYVALDTTALRPFVLIRASLIYGGRAIPLAWRVLRSPSTTVAFEDYQPVLEQAHVILSAHGRITLLADRGFIHQRLLQYLQSRQWHFRLRLMGKTLVHLPDQSVVAIRELCPPPGHSRFVQHVWLLGAAVGPVHLALAVLAECPDDPWFVASSEQATQLTLSQYALRFDIEESFRDDKSGGAGLHKSHLTSLEALERLGLVLALSTLYLTGLGVRVEQGGQRRWVDPHWQRRLSYLQLGWRWRKQQVQRGWPSFIPFQLAPVPQPLPLLATSGVALSEKDQGELLVSA